jgi:hypothetical protein
MAKYCADCVSCTEQFSAAVLLSKEMTVSPLNVPVVFRYWIS